MTTMANPMTPAQFHALRVALGRTQEEMAALMGLRDRSQVAHLESGRSALSGAKLLLAERLANDAGLFFVGDDPVVRRRRGRRGEC